MSDDADFLDASVAATCHTPWFCEPDVYRTMKSFRAVASTWPART